MADFYLYSTSACHLCETAKEILAPLLIQHGLQMDVIDISTDDQLIDKYGIRIPVLHCPGVENDLGWPFSLDDVQSWIASVGL